MNTPTHVLLSIATLTRHREEDDGRPTYVVPAVVGALLPDASMFVCCYVWSFKKHNNWKLRTGITLLAMIHLIFMALALMFWAGL